MKKRYFIFILLISLIVAPVSSKNMVTGNDKLSAIKGTHKIGAVFELESSVFAYRLLGFTSAPISSGTTVFAPMKDVLLDPVKGNQKKYQSKADSLFFSYIFKGKGTFTVSVTGSDLNNMRDSTLPPFKTETTFTILDPKTLVIGQSPKEIQVTTKRKMVSNEYSKDPETGAFLYEPVVIIKGGHNLNPYGSYPVSIIASYMDSAKVPYADGYSGTFSIRITSEV